MGSATQTSSAAQTSTQERAKREMNRAVDDDDLRRAADVGVTVLLATQPNGPAKVAVYSNAKHVAAFIDAAESEGVEAGAKAVGKSVTTSVIGGEYADAAVDSAHGAVSTAAENETVRRGVDAANKNLNAPSEQATEDTLAAIMTNGADALADKRRENRD